MEKVARAMSSNTYPARWGKSLRWMSAFSTVMLAAIAVFLGFKTRPEALFWLPLLPALILAGALPFVVRSYAIEPNVLAIRRLVWTTRLPLAGLQSATAEPSAMRGSRRLCGNGGMFSITGWYRNRALGTYRAFVTNLKDTVVLRFPARTIVISPENPEQFVAEISQFAFRTS